MMNAIRLTKDTRETVLFCAGLLGVISQGVVFVTERVVSYPLCGLYASMLGLPWVFRADERRAERRADNDDRRAERRTAAEEGL